MPEPQPRSKYEYFLPMIVAVLGIAVGYTYGYDAGKNTVKTVLLEKPALVNIRVEKAEDAVTVYKGLADGKRLPRLELKDVPNPPKGDLLPE